MSSQRSVAVALERERNAIINDSRRILSAKYLDKANSKKDLVKRLRNILRCLREDEDVEPDNLQDYPGLAALCQSLTRFVNHRDKEIRLYTVAACMELFTIYAPEAPWNEMETIDIFKQTIRQLANLGHSTGGSQQKNASANYDVHFVEYHRILELLAEVKIAVLLVDLSKKNDEDHDDEDVVHEDEDDESSNDSSLSSDKDELSHQKTTKTKKAKTKNNVNKEALQVLTELFRTLLQSVRNEHSTQIFEYCLKTLTSCIEEFFESTILPIPILDELLVCIGQGPRVLVLQQQPTNSNKHLKTDSEAHSKGRKKRAANNESNATPSVVVTVSQKNPSYLVAAAVIRASVERLSTPIATLLNGLVDSNPRSIGQSTISNHTCEDGNSSADGQNPRDIKIPEEIIEMVNNMGRPQRQQQDAHGTSNVYSIILELQRVAPAILTTVFGNLARHIDTTDVAQRILVVQTLGKLFAGNYSSSSSKSIGSGKISGNLHVPYQYNPCFRKWLKRSKDERLEIRSIMLPHLLALTKEGSHFLNGNASPNDSSSPQAELAREIQESVIELLQLNEPSAKFRTEIVQKVCGFSFENRKVLSRKAIDQLGELVMSKDKSVRKDTLTGLVQLHFQQFTRHHLATVLEGGDDCPIESVLEVLEECCSPFTTTTSGSTSLIASRSKVLSSFAGARNSPQKKRRRNGTRQMGRRRREVSDSEGSDHDEDEPYGSTQLSLYNEGMDDVSYYQWIPCVLFEAASYADTIDSDMHSRVIQLVDELLLGSSSPHPDNRRKLTSTGRATGLAIIVDAIRNQSPAGCLGITKLQSTRSKLQKSLKTYLIARSEIRNFSTGSEEYFAADAKAKDLLEKVATLVPGATPSVGERHPVLEKFHCIKDKHIFRILGTITNPNHSSKARARALDDLPRRVKATAGEAVQAWVKSLVKRCAMGDFINHDTIHHCVLLALECFNEGDLEATNKFLACVQMAVDSFPSLCAADEIFDNLSELFRECNSTNSSTSQETAEESTIITSLTAIFASVSPYRDSGTDSTKLEGDLETKLVALCQNGTPKQARYAVASMVSLLMPKNSQVLTEEQNNSFLPLLQTLAAPSRLTITSTGSSKKLVCVLAALTELAEHAPKIFESSSYGSKALKFAMERVLMGRAIVTNDDESDSEDDMGENETPKRGRNGRKSNSSSSHRSPSADNHNILENENLSVSCRTLCAAIEFLSTFIRSSIFMGKKTRSILPKTSVELIRQVFHILSQILRDQGLPPLSKERKVCSLRHNRAALRQSAAVNIFRLCDTRLGLDQKYLTIERWHYLASSLLDDERVVRNAVIEELGFMLTGSGKFSTILGMQPMAPRLRFVAMSVFCIDGSQGSNSRANANAANIGKSINSQKKNIANCITELRKTCESHAAQYRAKGPKFEEEFETSIKLTVMPEYAVPYAFHLLTRRLETPSSKLLGKKQGGKTDDRDNEIDESGNKILRKRLKALYDPLVQQLGSSADNISFLLRMVEMLSKSFEPVSVSFGKENGQEDQDKLTNICTAARKVLLSYIKTDANLDTHPGEIRMPGNLFRRREYPMTLAKSLSTAPNTSPTRSGVQTQRDDVEERIVEQSESTSISSGSNDAGERKHLKESQSNPKKQQSTKSNSGVDADVDSGDAVTGSQKNERKVRRSSRSTRSTKFDEPNGSEIPDSENTNDTHSRSAKGKRRLDSSQSSIDTAISTLHSPEGKNNLSNVVIQNSNRKRRSSLSHESFANSHVHFSPDVDFSGLSPINRRASRDDRKDQVLLSSTETKTRGSTPPSALRDAKFSATQSFAIGSTHSSDSHNSSIPATVSEETRNHSIRSDSLRGPRKGRPLENKKIDLDQSRPKRTTPNLTSGDKENTIVRATKKKKEVPKQIKIVRSKPIWKPKVAKVVSKKRTRAKKRGKVKKATSSDSFDFQG